MAIFEAYSKQLCSRRRACSSACRTREKEMSAMHTSKGPSASALGAAAGACSSCRRSAGCAPRSAGGAALL